LLDRNKFHDLKNGTLFDTRANISEKNI